MLTGWPLLEACEVSQAFLQECTLRDAGLKAGAASLGFVAHKSSLDLTRQLRQLVTLVRKGLLASAVDLEPGNLQGIILGDHRFLHMHTPSLRTGQLVLRYFVRLPLYSWGSPITFPYSLVI
jgi:hypothetical protein